MKFSLAAGFVLLTAAGALPAQLGKRYTMLSTIYNDYLKEAADNEPVPYVLLSKAHRPKEVSTAGFMLLILQQPKCSS